MLLGNSIVFVVVGLGITIFDRARGANIWGPEVKIAIGFAISMFFSISCYFVSWICVEWKLQEAMNSNDSL